MTVAKWIAVVLGVLLVLVVVFTLLWFIVFQPAGHGNGAARVSPAPVTTAVP